jgi:hypothetical protein
MLPGSGRAVEGLIDEQAARRHHHHKGSSNKGVVCSLMSVKCRPFIPPLMSITTQDIKRAKFPTSPSHHAIGGNSQPSRQLINLRTRPNRPRAEGNPAVITPIASTQDITQVKCSTSPAAVCRPVLPSTLGTSHTKAIKKCNHQSPAVCLPVLPSTLGVNHTKDIKKCNRMSANGRPFIPPLMSITTHSFKRAKIGRAHV